MRKNKDSLFWPSLRAVLKKELLLTKRTPAVITFAILFPILEILLLGYILDINVRHIPTVVYDLDKSQASRSLIDQFTNSNDFTITSAVSSEAELYNQLTAGQAKVGIEIPSNYSKELLSGQTATVLVLVDGSNASVTTEAVNISNIITLEASLKQLLAQQQLLSSPQETIKETQPAISVRSQVLFNPESRSDYFFLPGLIVWEIPATTILLLALSIAGETEKGTFEQLVITPINATGMIIGKMVPYGLLAFILLCLMLGIIYFVFGIPIKGSLLLLLLLSVLFIICGLALGLIVAVKATNQLEAMQMGILARVIPPFYLSGYIFSLESMPKIFQYFTKLLPDRHYMEITRGIILRGAGIEELWPQGLFLLGASLILLSFATYLYNKRLR